LVRLLVVEDDPAIAGPLVRGLERAGFTVTHAPDGASALSAEAADLVLLDLGLPDMDGTEVCRRLLARSGVPIIIVSARDDEVDRVVGLELGADDYVVKPFGLRELIARIRAVLRRRTSSAAPQQTGTRSTDADTGERSVTSVGTLVVDRRTRRVTVEGTVVHLTPKEFDLLAALAEDPGAVRSRTDLLDDVWEGDWYGSTRTLDAHVAALRRKVGADLIETVRGVGFRLADLP
jgi:two-component system, OmpR family, response regulator RegX3